MQQTEDFIKYTAELLVSVPDEIKVSTGTDDMGVLHTLKVADKDAGFILGKRGDTIAALRRIVRAIGARQKQRVSLRVDIPDKHSDKHSYGEAGQE